MMPGMPNSEGPSQPLPAAAGASTPPQTPPGAAMAPQGSGAAQALRQGMKSLGPQDVAILKQIVNQRTMPTLAKLLGPECLPLLYSFAGAMDGTSVDAMQGGGMQGGGGMPPPGMGGGGMPPGGPGQGGMPMPGGGRPAGLAGIRAA